MVRRLDHVMQTNKMATDDRGARILSDLNAAFKKDPHIDEYDVIPIGEPKHNKSPLVLVEHKIGLELWSVKILYEYSYSTLLNWRKSAPFKKQLGSVDLLNLSRAVVLMNPECATVWNIRKELIKTGVLRIEEDLTLGDLVFTKHPKSPEAFCHRKWLLNRLVEQTSASMNRDVNSANGAVHNGDLSVDGIDINIADGHIVQLHHPVMLEPTADYEDILSHELRVCELAADRYPSNYNAWSHRIWVVQNCYKCSLQVLLRELSSTETWVSSHVSDHSGFHYRQFLLTQLAEQGSKFHKEMGMSVRDLFTSERKLVMDLLARYPGHESLWYHRKFVFFTLHKHSESRPVARYKTTACTNERTANGHSVERESGCSLKKTRLENDAHVMCVKEIDCVCQNEMLSTDRRHSTLAGRYVEWIKKVYL